MSIFNQLWQFLMILMIFLMRYTLSPPYFLLSVYHFCFSEQSFPHIDIFAMPHLFFAITRVISFCSPWLGSSRINFQLIMQKKLYTHAQTWAPKCITAALLPALLATLLSLSNSTIPRFTKSLAARQSRYRRISNNQINHIRTQCYFVKGTNPSMLHRI